MIASLLNVALALLAHNTLPAYAQSSNQNQTDALAVCKEISTTLSNASAVFYPGNNEYTVDITKPASFFNRANATCAVEPGSNEDVALIMTSLRNHTHAPFGVMGGGHNLNTGFSSTDGVLISLNRFNSSPITHLSSPGPDNETATMDLGAGLQWQDVYTRAVAEGVNVLGGRFATVGVSGILLGGGYSWISNRHALASDNVIEYTMITPGDSKIQTITNASNPDLFFALKGGLNNFGIVTNFKVKAYPQTNKVWAGTLYTQPNNTNATVTALTNFAANNTDPDAQVIGSFVYGNNTAYEILVCFYNGENGDQPPEVFKEMLAIPRQNQSDFYVRTFDNFTTSSLATITFLDGFRTQYSTISISDHPLSVVESFRNERDTQGPLINAQDPSFFGSWTMEPFLHSYWDTAVESAVPHTPALVTFPSNLELTWKDPNVDTAAFASIRTSSKNILQAAVDAGQKVGGAAQIEYPNYALPDTPIANIYGTNLPRLREIRSKVDPTNVMYRAGGYKIV